MLKLKRNLIIVSLSLVLATTIFTATFLAVRKKPTELVEHSPIAIWGDEDFKNYDFPGRGTKRNPYLIQNYNITSNTSELIYISGTTKHFIIQNCYLKGDGTAIIIQDAADNTVKIIENTLEGMRYGIDIQNSAKLDIKMNIVNTVYVRYMGLGTPRGYFTFQLSNCPSSTIKDNQFSRLEILDSPFSSLTNNLVNYGIKVENSSSSLINENTVGISILEDTSSESGSLVIETSPDSRVINNEVFNGGYSFSDVSITVENNLVNDKDLGFFADQSDMLFESDQFGQIILLNSSNITIRNQEIANTTSGIQIISSYDVTIENSKINYCFIGLDIDDSSNLNIMNNEIANNTKGFDIYDSNNVHIVNNTVNNNSDGGFRSINCLNIELIDNSFVYNDNSIVFSNSPNSLVEGNLVTGGGIYLGNSLDSVISNNIMYEGGIEFKLPADPLENYLSYELTNNTLDNKKIGYYKSVDNASLPSEVFGQLFLINCSNFLIKDQMFQNVDKSVQIYYSKKITISNTTFTENKPNRMVIYMSDDCKLLNNTFDNAGGVGSYYSSNLTMMYNVFTNSSLYLEFSEDCILFNNSFEIGEGFGMSKSSNITVANNVFSEIHDVGFWVINNCSFTNNSIINTVYGFNGIGIDNCIFKYNLFLQIENYAIELAYSDFTIIHHNAFIDNNLGGTSQAYHRDSNNSTWYDEITLEGNFYSDYLGIGNYTIDGDAGFVDLYPLLTNPI